MKNFELFEITQRLGQQLPSLEKLKGPKFHYALLKNIDILEKELKILQNASKPTEKFMEYEKQRIALCEQFAGKDENGQVKKRETVQGQFEYDIQTESQEWKD